MEQPEEGIRELLLEQGWTNSTHRRATEFVTYLLGVCTYVSTY
jgi:hypothetical protein